MIPKKPPKENDNGEQLLRWTACASLHLAVSRATRPLEGASL
jgi:hypothetical protein